MSKQKKVEAAEGKSNVLDTVVVTAAIVVALAGLIACTFLTDYSMGIRFAMFGGSLVVAGVLAFLSASGKAFFQYAQASFEELRRVVWPSRKETVQTTGIVAVFVVAVAFYLFLIDKIVQLALYDGLLKLTF